ncbi:MAG: GWxTD domain-containing protein [Luteibaculum sp.]
MNGNTGQTSGIQRSIFPFLILLIFTNWVNISMAQRGGDLSLNPKLQFFRPAPDKLSLYFSLPARDLLYSRATETSQMEANILISCKGIVSKKNETLWNIEQEFSVRQGNNYDQYVDYLRLDEKSEFFGEILVTVRDVKRGIEYTAYSIVNKERIDSQQFLPISALSGRPHVKNYYSVGDSLQVLCSKLYEESIYTTEYQLPELPAPPPFVEESRAPQPTVGRNLELKVFDKISELPVIKKPALLEIKGNQEQKDMGLVLTFFKTNYPEIHHAEDMVSPLIFITTPEEFQTLQQQENKRKAAENFWLDRCRNKEKARRVIEEFYSRVVESNKYFTAEVEGWKTDRGMIYTIFGPPETVTKRGDEEIWVYGREINTVRLSFSFIKTPSNFSFNHYELVRNVGYKSIWDMATNSWRNGRVFSY